MQPSQSNAKPVIFVYVNEAFVILLQIQEMFVSSV